MVESDVAFFSGCGWDSTEGAVDKKRRAPRGECLFPIESCIDENTDSLHLCVRFLIDKRLMFRFQFIRLFSQNPR